MKRILLLSFVALGLTACSQKMPADVNPFGPEATDTPDYIERQDFLLSIIRFEDRRRPRAKAAEARDDIIYEYTPDDLLGGVSTRLPVLFSKHFGYGATKPNTLLVELDLQRLKTYIQTGTFSTGQFGSYNAELEVDVTVRDTDSSVLRVETYRDAISLRRNSFSGRSPSSEMDRSRMYQMVEEAVRRMTYTINMDARKDFRVAEKKRKIRARALKSEQRRMEKMQK